MASAREGRCEAAELAITTLTLLEMTSPCTSHLPPVSMEIFFNSRPEAQRPRPLATAGSVDTNGTLRCRGSGVFAQPLESPGWPWAVMLLEFGRSLFAGSALQGLENGCGSPVVKVSDYGRHVMSSSPVPLKTHRVEQRCTLNLSRAETSSRWCGVVVLESNLEKHSSRVQSCRNLLNRTQITVACSPVCVILLWSVGNELSDLLEKRGAVLLKPDCVSNSPRASAVAEFRLLNGHDCLCAHLFHFYFTNATLYNSTYAISACALQYVSIVELKLISAGRSTKCLAVIG
ncbi:uncharacterized protein TNCV_70871 [Trichonephila clavipes]|nr:uncharacterized protein TNCV_70871 [Trichonephila clavipes]